MERKITQSLAFPETSPTQKFISHPGKIGTCIWFAWQGFGSGGLQVWEEPHTRAGEKCEGSSPEKEERAETCAELTAASTPHPSMPLWGGGRENHGEVKPGKKGGMGIQIWVYSSLSCSGFIGNRTGFPESGLLCL